MQACRCSRKLRTNFLIASCGSSTHILETLCSVADSDGLVSNYDVIVKNLGCFRTVILFWTDYCYFLISITEARSLANNALKVKSRTIHAHFNNTVHNFSLLVANCLRNICWKFHAKFNRFRIRCLLAASCSCIPCITRA